MAPDLFGDLLGVGEDGASLAGRHQLERLEAERRGDTKIAHGDASPRRSVGVGCVLNDRQPMLLGDGAQRIDIRRMSSEVDRDDSPCTWGNGLFDGLRRKIKGARIDIGENRDSVARQYRRCGGDKSDGWNDHFVSTLDSHGAQRGFQCHRPISASDGVLDSLEAGEGRFKLFYLSHYNHPRNGCGGLPEAHSPPLFRKPARG